MSDHKTIKGKIVRILDKRTVIINLGTNDGIDDSTVFRILSEPESIIDPDTNEELGKVNVVKSKVKAKTVNEKFTIATTNWTRRTYSFPVGDIFDSSNILGGSTKYEDVDHGELNVDDNEIEPWKAKTEIPVKKGDVVEADIKIEEKIEDTVIEEDSKDEETGGDQEAKA